MRRECRERFPPLPRVSDPDMYQGTCVTHVPWCMPGSLISGFLWGRWRGKHSRHSRRMRNRRFYVACKRPIERYYLKCLNEGIHSTPVSQQLGSLQNSIDLQPFVAPMLTFADLISYIYIYIWFLKPAMAQVVEILPLPMPCQCYGTANVMFDLIWQEYSGFGSRSVKLHWHIYDNFSQSSIMCIPANVSFDDCNRLKMNIILYNIILSYLNEVLMTNWCRCAVIAWHCLSVLAIDCRILNAVEFNIRCVSGPNRFYSVWIRVYAKLNGDIIDLGKSKTFY